jgi:hypothetical protein
MVAEAVVHYNMIGLNNLKVRRASSTRLSLVPHLLAPE